ncbi:MAG: M28 family peptidase [Candidatus Kapabacteria bacterium]|nr:M28 family peptidase [Candidatus Kapabacteria bacterium]
MLLPLLLALLVGTPTESRHFPSDAEQHFDTASARRHLEYLSSDAMAGRDTPSPELELSADYIAAEFKRVGLEPINGSYSQIYNLERLDLALPATLQLVRGSDTLRCAVKTDFIPFDRTGDGVINDAPVVFMGYGITAAEYQYDDYAGMNVRGSVVLVLRGEPENSDTLRFLGKQWSKYASLGDKMQTARANGAVGILVIDALRIPRKPFVTGHPWPALYPNLPRSSRPLQMVDTVPKLPALHVGEAVLSFLLDSIPNVVSITCTIDSTLIPQSRDITGVRLSCSVSLIRELIPVRNVVGRLRGSEMPNEYAVMGAHYDHVGVGKANALGDSIFNGADDNGSGTTGLLLAAEALASSSERPKRSVVFVAFSGEEKGLYGSKAYVRQSPLPLSDCVAMFNMDMIGRCDSNKLSIGGNIRCPELTDINAEENAALKHPFSLAYDIEQYFFRSDQASFAMKRIPVLFYFTGEHADYHKQSDEISKINMRDLVGITRLATHVAWRATELQRTLYVPAGFEEK